MARARQQRRAWEPRPTAHGRLSKPSEYNSVHPLPNLDTSAYSVGYIAGWSNGDTKLVKSTAARVLRVSHQIAEILSPQQDGDVDDLEDATPAAAVHGLAA